MKMKINYTMFGTGLTGGVRVLLEIANRLIERGHEVTITSLGSENDHKWFPLKATTIYVKRSKCVSGIRYISRRYLNSEWLNSYPQAEIKKLAEFIPDDIDINVATLCFTAYSVFISEKGIPFYHMQHYEPLFFDDQFLKKLAEGTYYLPLNKIANSIWLRNVMKEKYGIEPPIVNPGIDHNVFYPREVEKEDGKLRVVAFGRQARWKGFPELLKAMEIVMKQRKDVELIVYGVKKPNYPSNVRYTFIERPSDDELAKLYSSADVVVLASWYESFPLPPIEAMACGAPVVTTRYGTEDYAFHEKNALVVPPKDPKALADAILRLLGDEDLREQFRKEGPKTAKQFTWDKTVDKVEKLFKDALRGRLQ